MKYTGYSLEVCICTFKRPEMLDSLLAALFNQQLDPDVRLAVLVVDNDPSASAAEVAEKWSMAKPEFRYVLEGARNIASARNRVLQEAQGDFILLIDDDELPTPTWASYLLAEAENSSSDVVLGPVLPLFSRSVQERHLVQSLKRPRHSTGTNASRIDWRAGNGMIRRSCLLGSDRFPEEFGLSGGEDFVFFARLSARGLKITWCDEAVVYEITPDARLNTSYIVKRRYASGQAYFRALVCLGQKRKAAALFTKASVYLALMGIPLAALRLCNSSLLFSQQLRGASYLGVIMQVMGFEFRPYGRD